MDVREKEGEKEMVGRMGRDRGERKKRGRHQDRLTKSRNGGIFLCARSRAGTPGHDASRNVLKVNG